MPPKLQLIHQSESNDLQAQIMAALELPSDQALQVLKRLGRMALQPSNSPLTLIQPDPHAPLPADKHVLGGPRSGGEAL